MIQFPFAEGPAAAAFIVSEDRWGASREVVAINSDVVPGQILGRLANGVCVPFDPTGNDGSERPAAISIDAVQTEQGRTKLVDAIVRLAEVEGDDIVWPAGITPEQKTAAIAALAASNVIVQ